MRDRTHSRNGDIPLKENAMKKTSLLFSAAVLLLSAMPLSAADYIVGVKGGYFLWDSYMKESNVSSFDRMERGDGVLYGPIFSVLFSQNLSLSFSGLMGRQSSQWLITNGHPESGAATVSSNTTFTVFRTDLDAALSFRMSQYFRFFAGYKYQHLAIELNDIRNGFDAGNNLYFTAVSESEIKTAYHGPALGLGLSIPVTGKYFLAANLSAVYMPGQFQMDVNSYNYRTTDGFTVKHDSSQKGIKSDLRNWGFNFEPTAGISPGEGLPIVTLGLRVQWTRVQFKEDLGDLSNAWLNDWVYGVFVGIMYAL
jgi:hypothetical protein